MTPSPDPTYTEALTYLQGSLPDDPALDDPPKRALRVVVEELQRPEHRSPEPLEVSDLGGCIFDGPPPDAIDIDPADIKPPPWPPKAEEAL